MKMWYKKKERKIKNKLYKNTIFIKQLVKSKNQYGSLNKFFKPDNKSFIYGFKFKQSILNIEQTSKGLKNMFFLITKFLNKNKWNNKKILIICKDYQKNQFNKITNVVINKQIEIKSIWEKNFLGKNQNTYSLIILFSSKDFEIIRNEVIVESLPIIFFLNSDACLAKNTQINYPIFYNDTKLESVYFIFSLLLNYFKNKNAFKI